VPEGTINQAIHLELSQIMPNICNLNWTPYIGFDYDKYYVYRGNSPDNLFVIDSLDTTHTEYTDTITGIAYYQIAVKKSSPCYITTTLKAEGEPISQSVSNLEDNLKYVNIIETKLINPINIFPNPFTDNINIETMISYPSIVQIELFDVMGSRIYEYSTGTLFFGSFKHEINSENLLQTSNILILRFEVNGNVYYQKLVKK
jgi:hypothetical protein